MIDSTDAPFAPAAEIAATEWYAYVDGGENPSVVAVLEIRPGETTGYAHLPEIAVEGIFPRHDALGIEGSDGYMQFIDTICALSVSDFERLKTEGRFILLQAASTAQRA